MGDYVLRLLGTAFGRGLTLTLRQGCPTESTADTERNRRIIAVRFKVREGRARARPYVVTRILLFAAVGGLFAIFVDILDYALEDEEVGGALAGELDAIAVIPFDRAT